MNPIPELTPMLKELKLSGILDSLDIRNREAIEEKLPYTDFLALLLQDEIARRANRKLNNRIKKAGFRNHKTLETFDFSFNPTINRAQIMDLATGRFIEENVCALVVGPCGTGKSHIVQALGHCAVRLGYDVLFMSMNKMLTQLHAARATNSFERRFSAFARVDLLILDDFGLRPLRGPQDEDLHDLISERHERKATVITSNLDFSEWGEAFPNKLLGAATVDRLLHGAYRVILDGNSYRRPRPLPDR
jgi:DNA replication protein DnaC